MLDDTGLLHALLWHFDRYTSQTGIRVDFKQSGMKRLPGKIEITIYRIIQEALTNAAHHSCANEVTVRLWSSQATINLEVKDKGIGFDPETVLRGGRTCGLIGIEERVKLLHGKFFVDSAPGTGTSLYVELPAEKETGGEI